MSFHLSQTPTLEAVANADEKLLAQDLDVRVAEVVAQIQAAPDVASAFETRDGAQAQLVRLRSAERALTQQVKESREHLDSLTGSLLDALVDGIRPESKKIAEVAIVEQRARLTGRAIERLTERQIPLAEITSLREEAHALMTEARATERNAQERAEKVLGQIREAVSGEMVLPVDMSKGVAGALLARVRSLKARAVQVSETADQLERAYQDRYEHS